MKIALMIVVASCAFRYCIAEYPMMKIRGPPHQRFVSHMKKWPQVPQRVPLRSRPIPMHMQIVHKKIPVAQQHQRPIPAQAPPRNVWKNQPIKYKAPQVEPQALQKKPEKTYLARPQVASLNFDHQIQSNAISTHHHPIKQVGDKGPIHTIPAPNLSLADRPKNFDKVSKKSFLNQGYSEPHQYQVTESAELQQQKFQKQYQQPLYFAIPDIQPQSLAFQAPQNEVFFNQKDLMSLLNQQQVLQAIQESSTSSVPLFKPEVNYIQTASDKLLVLPEMQSFNFEEQPRDKVDVESQTLDAVAQAQFIQKFFDTKEPENNVEPDVKEGAKEKLLSSEYYQAMSSSNQKAVESLAQLQAAGQTNNLLKKQTMRIYVPDESSYDDEEYDGNEDMVLQEDQKVEVLDDEQSGFGHRLKN